MADCTREDVQHIHALLLHCDSAGAREKHSLRTLDVVGILACWNDPRLFDTETVFNPNVPTVNVLGHLACEVRSGWAGTG